MSSRRASHAAGGKRLSGSLAKMKSQSDSSGAQVMGESRPVTLRGHAIKEAGVVPKDSSIGDNGLCDTPSTLASDLEPGGADSKLVTATVMHEAAKKTEAQVPQRVPGP